VQTQRGHYEKRLDAETWDCVDRVNAWYPPGVIDLPVEKQRATYDECAGRFMKAIHRAL